MWFQEAERIYLVPIGKIQWWLLDETKDPLQELFGKEVFIHNGIDFPYELVSRDREQLHSTRLIDTLAGLGLRGLVLGITDYDLYVPGLNFVFGEADPIEGTGVISIKRLKKQFQEDDVDQGILIERTIKEAVHEMGHLFGLKHCPASHCAMHFSDTVEATDGKEKAFCEACYMTLAQIIKDSGP